MVVAAELELRYNSVELGEIELIEVLSEVKHNELRAALQKWDFELLDDRKAILVERVKNVIVEMIHYSKSLPHINYSAYISKKLAHDYTYLSNIFSEIENITIEHFIIAHKIEYNISEIAAKLNYSSVAHLSNQFKKVAGITPSFFKAMKNKNRIPLDDV
jgi:AraC-like DNA-binding protein